MIKISFFVAVLLFICTLASAVSATDYNVSDAVDAVYYSKIAYCSLSGIRNWNCAQGEGNLCQKKFPGMRNVTATTVELSASSGWTGYDSGNNRIVLAFEGTVNPQGWIEDFDFFKTLYDPSLGCGSDCYVHQGLYWGMQEIMKTLLPAMLSLAAQNPTADIWVTGHSMGAGQASLAFPLVQLKVPTKGKHKLFNFGCPRVGTVAFTKWRRTVNDEHAFRMTNFGDPVVHLPPLFFDKIDLGMWIHDPREIFYENAFGSPNDYKICDGNYTYEDKSCADSTPPSMFSFKYHTTYLGIGMGCFLEP